MVASDLECYNVEIIDISQYSKPNLEVLSLNYSSSSLLILKIEDLSNILTLKLLNPV